MSEIRYEVAVAAAGEILELAGIEPTPELHAGAAHVVLEALDAVECRRDGRPRPLLCGSCLLALRPRPGEEGLPSPCPRRRRPACPVDGAARN